MILIRRDTIGLGPLLITFDPHFNPLTQGRRSQQPRESSCAWEKDGGIINSALKFTGDCWRPLDVDHSLLLQTHARVVMVSASELCKLRRMLITAIIPSSASHRAPDSAMRWWLLQITGYWDNLWTWYQVVKEWKSLSYILWNIVCNICSDTERGLRLA